MTQIWYRIAGIGFTIVPSDLSYTALVELDNAQQMVFQKSTPWRDKYNRLLSQMFIIIKYSAYYHVPDAYFFLMFNW